MPRALPPGPHARRHLQRPRRTRGWARSARASGATCRSSARSRWSRAGHPRAEPAARQPRAADARASSSRRRRSTCSPAPGSSSRCTTGSATARTRRSAPWEVAARRPTTRGSSGRCSIPRTRRDPTSDDDPTTPPTYVTADSHWWDGSQIYGSDAGFARRAPLGRGRQAAPRRAGPPARRPRASTSTSTGVAANFWVGLGILHTLFTLEHNAICDALRAERPVLDGRRALRPRAARQLGADGEDPHGRVDAGDHRAPDDEVRDERELVGPRRASASRSGSAGSARARC